MIPLLAYLVDSAIDVLDILDDGDEIDEIDDIVMLPAPEEGEEEEEEEEILEVDDDEEGDVIVYDSDEISQEELSQDTQETDDSDDDDDDDDDEDSPPLPKLRHTQNVTNPRDAETSSNRHADDTDNRPSTSRQPPVDFRHSVQLQLAPQPTLYQQDERLEPQLITIQARSTLESSSSQSTQTNGLNVQRGIVVVPQVQQFHRSDFLQSFSQNSVMQGREGSYSVNHRIHFLHLYPREE